VSAVPAAAAPGAVPPLPGRAHLGRAIPAHHAHTQPSSSH
jgi:hypothetical protein